MADSKSAEAEKELSYEELGELSPDKVVEHLQKRQGHLFYIARSKNANVVIYGNTHIGEGTVDA